MCTASIGDIDDIADPVGNAIRRDLAPSTANALDPIGTSMDQAQEARDERDQFLATPFNQRLAFTDAASEQDYQSYFAENQQSLVGEFLTDQGTYDFRRRRADAGEGEEEFETVDSVGLERQLREDFTAMRNEERTRQSRERARSTQVLSNVARRRQARQQQFLADTGTSGAGRQLTIGTGERRGTLLTDEEDRRTTLLGGTL